MSNYKTGKWANEIINLQKNDGSWGNNFHSLAMPVSKQPMSTEQALRRLLRLGFTKDDEVIKNALLYMNDCLAGKMSVPDYQEKRVDFNIFINLMLAVWIRRFTRNDELANSVAKKWRVIVEAAFSSGEYDPDAYIHTLYEVLKPKYGTVSRTKELLRLDYYYPVSILAGEINESIEQSYYNYVMDSETGYYYGYAGAVTKPPKDFKSKNASRFLSAVEIYCEHPNKYCKNKLKPVVNWLNNNKNANGKWDMGASVKDGAHFPLSDSWKTVASRETDCTYRIEKIISALRGLIWTII